MASTWTIQGVDDPLSVAYEAHGHAQQEGIDLMHAITHKDTSYISALMRLAREMINAMNGQGFRLGNYMTDSTEDNVKNLINELNGTENMVFDRKKTEDFPPSAICDAETVQYEYLEVEYTDIRYKKSKFFNPQTMVVSNDLMAFLKLLVLEDYAGFTFWGNTPDAERFPAKFLTHLVSAVETITVADGNTKRLIVFRSRALATGNYLVSPQFWRLWKSGEGLSAKTIRSTRSALISERADALERKRETAAADPRVLPAGAWIKGVTPFPGETKVDNTMMYIIVGGCLFAALFYLNRR